MQHSHEICPWDGCIIHGKGAKNHSHEIYLLEVTYLPHPPGVSIKEGSKNLIKESVRKGGTPRLWNFPDCRRKSHSKQCFRLLFKRIFLYEWLLFDHFFTLFLKTRYLPF